MPDVEVTVTTTPIDVYINSDPTVYVNTATQGIQGPSAPTGDFVSRSETGLFYPASNPSGFVPSNQPIFETRPQVEQEGGGLLGLAYVTEVGDKLPNPNDFGDLVKWNGNEWIAQKIDYSEIQNPPPSFNDRLPLTSNDGDALFWTNEVDNERWIGRQITVNDISGTGLFYPASNPLNFVTSSQLNDVDINNTQLRRDVVYITGDQRISGLKSFDNTNFHGLYADGNSLLSRKYTLITAPGIFVLYNFTGASGIRTTGISFSNDRSFNIYGSGQSAIKLYEKLITGFDNINSRNFISDYNGYFGWLCQVPSRSSRFTSKEGGGWWVTLDRADGSPENLNVAGNLQVGSGSGIQAQRLYVRGDALITTDLTVNTSGNFVSGLFVNRRPVLTGVLNSGSGIRLASGTRNNDLILKNISGKNNITVSETGNLINVQLNDTIYAANQLAEINLLSREITNFDFRSAVFNVLPLSNQVYLSDFNLAEEGQEFVPFNFIPGQAFDLTPSGKNGTISLYKETGLISGFIIDSPQILINGTDILDLTSFSGDISNLESMISGLSGYSESTYATKVEVSGLSGIVTGNNYALTEMINSLSGYADLNFATILNLNQTGELLLNQVNSLSGTITGSYATKQYVIDSINTLSGNLTFVNYKYILTSGYDSYEVTFPQPFVQAPRTIMVQMENEEYNIIYAYDVYNITSGGFSIKFSDILAETNNLMVLAKA